MSWYWPRVLLRLAIAAKKDVLVVAKKRLSPTQALWQAELKTSPLTTPSGVDGVDDERDGDDATAVVASCAYRTTVREVSVVNA